MKIAICGAGLTGSYLYRLLKNDGFNDITVFDVPHDTKCGINPCAWGTNSPGIEWFIERAGLDPAHYILRQFDHAMFGEMEVKINFATINKPGLIKDLLEGADIQVAEDMTPVDHYWLGGAYDRVVDATGTARAYLPRIQNDFIAPCVQYRMKSDEPVQPRIKLGKLGYAWMFPLSDRVFHVGASSLRENPVDIIGKFLEETNVDTEMICSCRSNIRLSAPAGSLPFFNNNVVGVGESIGCVSPLAGDGIIPGLRSALILKNNWYETPGYYQYQIIQEFKWMEIEWHILNKFRQGKNIGLIDAWKLRKNPRRMGMNLSTLQTLKLFRRYL